MAYTSDDSLKIAQRAFEIARTSPGLAEQGPMEFNVSNRNSYMNFAQDLADPKNSPWGGQLIANANPEVQKAFNQALGEWKGGTMGQSAIDVSSGQTKAIEAQKAGLVNPGLSMTPEQKQAYGAMTPPEVSTARPSPNTVSATPFTQGVTQPQGTPGQIQAQTTQGMRQAFEAVKSTPAPTTPGQAKATMQAATPTAPPSTVGMELQLNQDPAYQQLLADRAEYTNVANQGKSLMETYGQLMKEAQIPQINEALINTQRIIDGTEDDIRSEVQAAQGFATDSQVLAMASSRNKQLIKNYNQLLATKQMAQEQVNTMMSLTSQDREFALNSIMQKMQIDQQIIEYRDKFVRNAREGYQNIINAVGYSGLMEMLGNDPDSISLAEKTLGLGQGQLQNVTNFIRRQTQLKKFEDYTITSPFVVMPGGEVQNTQTGEAYTSPQDFEFKTGMTLDQASKQGLIKPLGLTQKEEQQKFENVLKLEELAMSKQRLGLEGARVNIAKREQALKEKEFYEKQSGLQDQRIKEIIDANPGEWGKAAAQIEAEFGKIPTGSRTDQILNAVYSQGMKTSDILPSMPTSKLNVEQSKARQFGEVGAQALQELKDNSYNPKYIELGSPVSPWFLWQPNAFKSSERQQFERSARAFVNAVLRRESGATITDTEFNNKYKELIPMAGDGSDVLIQKDQARLTALNSIREAGMLPPLTPTKRMRVKDKNTGQTGTIPANEFNSQLYERIQ